jgi:pilus assembly protein FimV
MKSAVRRILLMSALLSPNALFALGLGEIHLNSALNQPFDADIDLVSAADEDLSALRASIAPGDTFSRYGLDKPAYLADFTFRVVRGANGQDVLKVTSPRPVTEPFVTLLVEANWPRGRLLREYTVLLDPPVYAPSARAVAAPVASPRVTAAPSAQSRESDIEAAEPFAAAPQTSGAASSPDAPARPARTSVAAPSISAGSTYRVRQNDTLWKIASAAYPGTRSDVNRAMVAIYQSNPQAFDGNINVLRAGSLLKVPTASDVSAISASAAAVEVSRQYRMWREGVPAAEGPDAASGRLRLVTPEQGTPAASTATTRAQAGPAASSAGSGQLQSRVQQLEAELAEARRLLEVRNAELATLQAQAGASQPGVAAPAVTAPAEAPTVSETAPPAGPAAEAPAAPVEAAPAPAPKPAAKPPKVSTPKPKPEAAPSLIDRLAEYWWVLLGLLAAALGYAFYKRGHGAGATKEVDLREALARTTTDLRATSLRTRDSDIVVEERRPVEPAAAPRVTPAPRATEPGRRSAAVDDTLSGDGPVSIEAGDPLAEADFHMAYGLYDQAADLVQLAIKREPARRDLKLKLLEIFFVWGNRDRFLEQAREMNASRGDAQPSEWDKVLIMGKQLAPDDVLFAGASRAGAADLDMELPTSDGPLDMDLGEDYGITMDIDVSDDTVVTQGGAGLDFVIDEPQRGTGGVGPLDPTMENPNLWFRETPEDPTQEVAIEDLAIDAGHLGSLDDLDTLEGDTAAVRQAIVVEDTVESLRQDIAVEDTIESPRQGMVVEDTVERPRPMGMGSGDAGEEEADMLSTTSMLKKDATGILRALASDGVTIADLTVETTGVLPTIQTERLGGGSVAEVDFAIGEEAATMSEVGTKLDLARAYIDMGDPEGARSILDEVLKEGSAVQKQEAERLVSSLP